MKNWVFVAVISFLIYVVFNFYDQNYSYYAFSPEECSIFISVIYLYFLLTDKVVHVQRAMTWMNMYRLTDNERPLISI